MSMSLIERNILFDKIQHALQGHGEAAVTDALISALVVAIGIGAPSLPAAVDMIGGLPDIMLPILRSSWGTFREHRNREFIT